MDRTTIKAISLGVFLLTLAPAAVKRIREAGLGKVMLLRVAGGLAILSLVAWAALGIDSGRFDGQPHMERTLLVTGMMIGMAVGIIMVVSVLWAGQGVFSFPYKFIAWASFAVVALVALMVVGEQVEQRYGIYHGRPLFAVLGLGLIAATLLRPWWFWDHAKARFLRNIIGDTSTVVLYLLLGILMGWNALARPWSPKSAGTGRHMSFSGRLTTCFALRGAGVDSAELGGQIAYRPGHETGFVLWMPDTPMDDPTHRVAHDGTWHRLQGDSVLVRVRQDRSDTAARIIMADGAFPRAGRIDLPAGEHWGNDSVARVIPVQLDSVACSVEIRGRE